MPETEGTPRGYVSSILKVSPVKNLVVAVGVVVLHQYIQESFLFLFTSAKQILTLNFVKMFGATTSGTGVALARADTINIISGRDVSSILKVSAAPPFRGRHCHRMVNNL